METTTYINYISYLKYGSKYIFKASSVKLVLCAGIVPVELRLNFTLKYNIVWTPE